MSKTIKGIGSISLTWVRPDLPKELTYAYWREAHGQLVSRNNGCFSYRQVRYAERPLLKLQWPVDQDCPKEWIPDGFAENLVLDYVHGAIGTFGKVARMTHEDEKNAFSRCLLNTTKLGDARFTIEKSTATKLNGRAFDERIVVFFRKEAGQEKDFNKFLGKFEKAVKSDKNITELHSYKFQKYNPKLWVSENIDGEFPEERQYHACFILGAEDFGKLEKLLNSKDMRKLIMEYRTCIARVNAFQVADVFVCRYDSKPTIQARRGAYVADILEKTNATNQYSKKMLNLLTKTR